MAERTPPTSRREVVASKLRRRGRRWLILKEPIALRDMLARPETPALALVWMLFVVACSAMVWLGREQLPLVPGRIMDATRAVRVEFSVVDDEATRQLREVRQTLAPRVYRVDKRVLDKVLAQIRTLPEAALAAGSPDKLVPEVIAAFALTPAQFEAVKSQVKDTTASPAWKSATEQLGAMLEDVPLLSASEYQLAVQDSSERMELDRDGGEPVRVSKGDALVVDGSDEAMRARVQRRVSELVGEAGFAEMGKDAAAAVSQRLTRLASPLDLFDAAATQQRKDEEAAKVAPVRVTHRPGETIFRRGEPLDASAAQLAVRENEEYKSRRGLVERMTVLAGVLGLNLVLAGALGGYLGQFYRALCADPARLAALTGMIVATLAASCWAAVAYPSVAAFATLAPTVLVAMVCVIAFDRRLVLAVAGTQVMMLGAALQLPASHLIVAMVGVSASAWQLAGVRHRNDVIRAGLVVAGALGVALVVAGMLERPAVAGVGREILRDAAWGLAAGFLPAVLALAFLPTIERAFDVVTGMTLSELRDPKAPLLRLLAERAPGTSNHSHTVAIIAESAAEAIGADGLHVYVGALYHDIGKLNKPEYFVENQQGGVSRHARLSPAMSLLVIVGHVKDGVELAREYKLPRGLQHYIQSHHGTTLVEYFYDAARRAADDAGDAAGPSEIEYRYPGPKPRTKEAAILMLCDAVESATRAMAEPTPARISSLVHTLASKRLADGQFDECELTMRELTQIEEAVTKALSAYHHARIAYPTSQEEVMTDAGRHAIERTA